MSIQKFVFVNMDGDYEESSGAFERSDFVSGSLGVASSGKPIILGSDGKLGSSLINVGAIDHNALLNTHNLTTDINHADITGTHNLTTDINHANITGAHNLTTDIDHGGINGLADDDHTIYSLASGVRDFSGVVKYAAHPTFDTDEQLVDKKYVDELALGTEWQNSVLDFVADPPGGANDGDRYLVAPSGTGAWSGYTNYIAVKVSGTWQFTAPTVGMFIGVDDETNGVYLYGGSEWDKKYFESTTASNGVKKVGLDIQLNLITNGGLKIVGEPGQVGVEPNDIAGKGLVDDGTDNLEVDLLANGGLKFVGNEIGIEASDIAGLGLLDNGSDQLTLNLTTDGGLDIVGSGLSVDVSDFAGNGLEDNGSNKLQLDLLSNGGLQFIGAEVAVEASGIAGEGLMDDGTDNLAIDWATSPWDMSKAVKASDLSSTSGGKGASIIGIQDVGGYTTATTVEAAIQDIYLSLGQVGVSYAAQDVGGVTKGDMVFVGTNDKVKVYSDITTNKTVIGVAASTEVQNAQVKVLANDTIVTGVLSAATAGKKQYWTGSAYTETMPTGSGEYVWVAGVAKNATDLHVQIEFIKKNA